MCAVSPGLGFKECGLGLGVRELYPNTRGGLMCVNRVLKWGTRDPELP